MDCRKCKNYANKKCSINHHAAFRDGTIDATEYNVIRMILKDGKYIECINDFASNDEITLFDFIEGGASSENV